MSTTRKIEGYATEADVSAASGIWLFMDRVTANKATLVTFTGERERVYTESELRAMMRSITHVNGSPVRAISIDEVRRVFAEEHGLPLDPA